MDPGDAYNECLQAMKHAQRESTLASTAKTTLREPKRSSGFLRDTVAETPETATRGSIIASMVPDEVILQHSNYSLRRYETALMFIDVSGFTDLCERYTKADSGGPSRLTQVLNSYIGAMVQEILTHGGDVLNFSGDAFLTMWKNSSRQAMQTVVHCAIDCGLSIQKNYGTYHTDVGVVLKVKIAISAGVAHFALIGDATHSHYVILGQSVWDVKIAEYLASAGDVMTAASAWTYANQAEYITEPFGDGKHIKVLQAGVSWKRVGHTFYYDKHHFAPFYGQISEIDNYYREFSLRPAIVSALRTSWSLSLRKFMVKPVIWAVENDEPMEFLTEIRRVVIVFLNIIIKTVTDERLAEIVNTAFKCVYSISSAADGLLNKVSMFDKDLMFLIIFGLRGMTHADEAQKSLLCAQALKESLVDPNFISLSIGISSGTTYCGVVGHVLRREYTVIGSAVNKAARLMMTYPDKLTCDKETFLKSKMDQQFFRLLEFKPMKGIKKPGPVYEFNKYGEEELRTYLRSLQHAMRERQTATRSADHVYGMVFLGPTSVGKTRLMEECLHLTPNVIPVMRISSLETDKVPYGLFRQIAVGMLIGRSSDEDHLERIIRNSVKTGIMSPVQRYAINELFSCHFSLPNDFHFTGDILAQPSIPYLVCDIFSKNVSSLWVVALEEARHIDDESWKLLLILLDTSNIFVIITMDDYDYLSDVAHHCISNNMLLKMTLSELDHSYHSAVACQFLDVQAIPADLEMLIESASKGMPGWIQNFIISLVQQGDLSIATMSTAKAIESGAVMPPPYLLHRAVDSAPVYSQDTSLDEYFEQLMDSLNIGEAEGSQEHATPADDLIQVAVLAESYEVLNINMSIGEDAIILKTYDSLSPFEKMLLKCSSVLGVVFPRRMMQYLLQCDSPKKIAQAVAKLFNIRVLECEGGDFTQRSSKVLIHPSPVLEGVQPPYCSCLGIKRIADCEDLPDYAFCSYMRFKHPLFRTTTYELLTETQKHEMHGRALLYLEHYTRRCWYCGSGCFHQMMGKRTDDGLVEKSVELKNTQRMIRELAAETNQASGEQLRLKSALEFAFRPSIPHVELTRERLRTIQKDERVRSFSSLDLANCECLAILMMVYSQIIEHCRGSGKYEKLIEAYLEYADLNVMNSNTIQALRLLNEAESFVLSGHYCSKVNCKVGWLKEFYLGRIMSLRGGCMLASGELLQAREHLYHALELFRDPFPTTKHKQRIRNMQTSIRWIALKLAPKACLGKESGLVGIFFEEVAITLNRLYKLFIDSKEYSNAKLVAKWSLDYATRRNANFELLCKSYGNMINIHLDNEEFSRCMELETLAMQVCRRKRGVLDDTEMRAVSQLYTSLCLFYAQYGKKTKSLEYGLPAIHMVSKLMEPATHERVVIWVLQLMLSDLRIADMVSLMRESLHPDDQFSLTSSTWYYFYSMVILLDTGYCVESYQNCERFYIKNGDTILRSKSKDAAYDYFACMWLITLRVGAWERSVLWQEQVNEILSMDLKHIEYKYYLQLILFEGLLISLVREIETANKKKIAILQKSIKNMLQTLQKCSNGTTIYVPRYFLLLAYYCYIRGKEKRAHSYIEKSFKLANDFAEGTVIIWAEHTRQIKKLSKILGQITHDLVPTCFNIEHWAGTLDPALEDYWKDHVEPDNLLDYRNFSDYKLIIPFTLPLPKTYERE